MNKKQAPSINVIEYSLNDFISCINRQFLFLLTPFLDHNTHLKLPTSLINLDVINVC